MRRRAHHRRAPPARSARPHGAELVAAGVARACTRPCSSRRTGRQVTCRLPARRAVRRGRAPAAISTPPSSRSPAGAASTFARVHASRRSRRSDRPRRAPPRRRRRGARASRDRGRRSLVDGSPRARAGRAPRSRRVARGPAVLRRCRRRPPLGALRTRPPSRLRVGVPAAGRRRERRLRRAARRRAQRPRPQGAVARAPRRPSCATSSARARARPSPCRAWPIPTRYDPARLANGRVLFVGDAAGVVDPMTGEGIAQALETGMLAAEAIAHGGAPERSPRATDGKSGTRSGAICASPPCCRRCCGPPSAHARPSPPPTSRRGPAGTSPAGCSRTIRGHSCSRPIAGAEARSRRPARTG